MRDIPRYFREQIDDMRAGESRGFTPPRVTMRARRLHHRRDGRDARGEPFYAPFKEMLSSIAREQRASRPSEARGDLRIGAAGLSRGCRILATAIRPPCA